MSGPGPLVEVPMLASVEEHATLWERIRWPDHDPLPAAGTRLTLAVTEEGHALIREFDIVDARPDSEAGWIQVELRVAS